MKKVVTLVRFMNAEELVTMVTSIKNFKNPITGKMHHAYKTCKQSWEDKWARVNYRFNIKNLDYVDALMFPDGGYVRYRGCQEEVLYMLKVRFGFEEE